MAFAIKYLLLAFVRVFWFGCLVRFNRVALRRTLLFTLIWLFSIPHLNWAAELVSTHSIWRFRKGETEASFPETAWRAATFDDASAGFTDAPAPFWYGDERAGGTELVDMATSYSCIFLRHAFTIDDVSQVSTLRLRAYVDD
ncbi:MAG TPA: hypothetical protein VEC99_15095, partial [Clostridia bacterium]|nr:hypothetical protein [Clostridia bacterium]